MTEFLLRVGNETFTPTVNADDDLICPRCGAAIESQWADDGESSEADWFHCEECKADGALVRADNPDLTQNGVPVSAATREP